MMILKPKKVKDLKYRKWLHDKRCMMCGRVHTTGHHLPNPEGGQRRSRDDLQICLCLNCHQKMHKNPNDERSLLPIFYREANKLWDEYNEERGLK